MPNRKSTSALSGLVATKGRAKPSETAPRTAGSKAPAASAPLNFRVTAEFRKRFRVYAATHDLRLNELLVLAFGEYEKRHGD